jgi:hypothetical protein
MLKVNRILLLAFILVLVSASSVLAQSDSEVKVGLYLLNLGKFDITTGSFTADFYLSFKCDSTCPEIDFEFMNGRASSIDKMIDTENEKFYRIQANLNSPVDLKQFPFDKQQMQIIIEDKTLPIQKLRFVPNTEESGIDNSIAFTGWSLEGYQVEEKRHDYDIYGETYSQYVFTIPITRIIINAVIKTFLPIIFIVIVMLSSFFLDLDKVITRLGMAGSALVASVMFHISISNQIPPVGYLTFADKFMLVTYFIILLTFGMNVLLLKLIERNKKGFAEKLHRYTEYSMFFIVAFLYALLFIFGL